MRIALGIGIVVFLVYLIWVVVPGVYWERKFPTPRPVTAATQTTPTPTPTQGRYRVTIESAKIFPTNEQGKCWDPCTGSSREFLSSLSKRLQWTGGDAWQIVMGSQAALLADQSTKQPDVYVQLKFGNQSTIQTHTVKNSLNPQWGIFHDLNLSSTDALRIYVWDQDPVDSELIGYYATAQIPTSYLTQGGTWTLKFKRVYELRLTIKPLSQQPPQILQPGRYRVSILSAVVKRHKTSGKAWDAFGGNPDPYAVVRLGPHQLETPPIKNTLYPAWNHARVVTLKGDEFVTVSVYDKDIGKKDDTIGECKLKALHQIKLQEGVLLRISCGQIEQINIQFDRIL